jgi:hypothetical protein
MVDFSNLVAALAGVVVRSFLSLVGSLPVEALKQRLREFGDVLQEEAVVALRELLEEREQVEQETS